MDQVHDDEGQIDVFCQKMLAGTRRANNYFIFPMRKKSIPAAGVEEV
jgi:hypothetical protein